MPIYLGAPNIGDFYNLDGIVIMDKNANGEVTFNSEILSDEYYNDHIDAVKDNYERVLQTQTAEDFMFLNYFNE